MGLKPFRIQKVGNAGLYKVEVTGLLTMEGLRELKRELQKIIKGRRKGKNDIYVY